jgi:HK97 family phage prohead protease
VISTGAVDRDKDRVFPTGAKLANYLKNPVVLWGHNYYSADALIGRAKTIEVTETGIVADFELRPAATDVDPQNIVLLLWAQKFVHASSIGFRPEPGAMLQNEFGGIDFVTWELLEFSLVSVPANADALRLAAEAYPKAFKAFQKRGRVLSAANESKIKQAHDNLGAVLEQIAGDDDDGKSTDPVADLASRSVTCTPSSITAGAEEPRPLRQRPTR